MSFSATLLLTEPTDIVVYGPCPVCEILGWPGWQVDVVWAMETLNGYVGVEGSLFELVEEAIREHDDEAHPGALTCIAAAAGGDDARYDHPVLSTTSIGARRFTWRELYEQQSEDRRRRLDPLALMISDLDRCEHGRHQGDICGGTLGSGCDGPSLGNPVIRGQPPGEALLLGYDIGGRGYELWHAEGIPGYRLTLGGKPYPPG